MAPHQQTLRDRQVGRPAAMHIIPRYLDLTPRSVAGEDTQSQPHSSNLLRERPRTIRYQWACPQSTPILNSDGDPTWKALVFDDLGRDVISSVLRVNDLRGFGVTIHLLVASLNADKDSGHAK